MADEEKVIPINVNYDRVYWEDNDTPMDAEHFNIMDKGIKDIVDAYNSLPVWVKSQTKPRYTAPEVGADIMGTAQQVVEEHNNSFRPHEETLSSRTHTHNISNLLGYDTLEANNSKLLGNQSPEYYLDYNNLNNKPEVKTKVSEFENDCHYITADEFRVLLKGTYAGGTVTKRYEQTLSFMPKELHIYEKNEYTGKAEMEWTFTESYDAPEYGLNVEFGEDYFAITSIGDYMNKPNRVYLWFVYSTQLNEVTTYINKDSTDNQIPTAKAVYNFVEKRINDALNN